MFFSLDIILQKHQWLLNRHSMPDVEQKIQF